MNESDGTNCSVLLLWILSVVVWNGRDFVLVWRTQPSTVLTRITRTQTMRGASVVDIELQEFQELINAIQKSSLEIPELTGGPGVVWF